MSIELLQGLRAQAIAKYLDDGKGLREALDRQLREYDEAIEKARKLGPIEPSDPLVLVRGSKGQRRTVYHSAANPCGRTGRDGGKSKGFDVMLESEAQALDRGFTKRCSACWPNG